MKNTRYAVAICAVVLIAPLSADTFMMKDGSSLEGKILREDPTTYVLEVDFTKSIKDERVVQKADVLRIKREKPDLIAYEKIEKLVPTPDLLTTGGYAVRIAAVNKFLTKYPKTPKIRKAKEILATLNAESEAIAGGAMKVKGKMLSPDEYKANAYDIDAGAAQAKIRSLVIRARYLVALRKFDDFNRDFRNTQSYAELLPLMKKVEATYVAGIQRSLSSFDARLKERLVDFARMSQSNRSATKSAIAEELAALETRFEAEKKAKVGWVTTHPFFKPSLEETVKYGEKVTRAWNAASSGPAMDGGKAYRDALSLIQSSAEASQISTAIGEAKKSKIPQSYIDTLDAAAASKATP